ncbi:MULTISPECIES: lipopolysaccharide biosynthesis protein [unclassified Lentimicrobium]|uniref:lipopolysaccharide biosynthesis protein n=1 Tax=unclassified Lentimicrobium TaxID=2677434 RepID=UPI001556EF04|nr:MULTISPECIES: oligosaccharide flippase family protein [unclassified Lentimicrobium]NPD46429.1 oligosaccharide flippase family protein [Lentimicrobium sp. S6]NPD84930.1 oligosaccharide flippase family protein [Lentimicrobium sp. L6]
MIEKFKKSGFMGPVLTILSGSTLAQLIPLASEIILVRLFTPAEFGILALFLAVATLFSALATARYEMAIVLPKEDDKAINILALSLTIALLMTILSGIIVWIFGEQISQIAKSPALFPFLKWVPLFVLVSGIFQSFNLWATRKKYYKNIAYSKVSQSSTNASVSIGTGYLGFNSIGLIWGQISGWFIGSLPLIFKFWRNDMSLLKSVNRVEIVRQAKEHSDFPKINSLHVLSDIGQQSIVNIIISRFFSDATLGFYSRMIRIVKVPAGFIGSAMGQVFYQKASEQWQKDKDIRALFTSQVKMMALLGLPIFILLAIFGTQIFGFVLGKDWAIAGHYAQILSPWLFLNFLISPFTHIPLITQNQKRFFALSLSMNIMVIIAFVIGHFTDGTIETSLMIVCAFQVVFHLYLGYWFYKISIQHPE